MKVIYSLFMSIFMLFLTVKYFIFTDDEFAINSKINIEIVPSCLFTRILSWKSIQIIFFIVCSKMSTGKGFWYQLQVTGKPTFKKAIAVERTRKSLRNASLIWICQLNVEKVICILA